MVLGQGKICKTSAWVYGFVSVYCCLLYFCHVTSHSAENEYEPNTDFTAGPFVTRRDPQPEQELIHTFIELLMIQTSERPTDISFGGVEL